MVQAIGSAARYAYVEESTWGTTPGSPSMKTLKALGVGENLSGTIEELQSNAISGARDVESVRGGNIEVSGSAPFELSVLGVGTILKHALGAVVTTGAGPYTHTIKRAVLPPGLTIEKGFPDISRYFVFTGCKIEQLDLSVASSGLVAGNISFLGKDMASATSELGTPSAVTHEPIVHHEASTVEEGGSAAIIVGASMSIKNNHDGNQYQVGSRFRAGLAEGRGEATGTVSFLFEDVSIWDKWRDETESSLKLIFTVTGGSIEFYWPRIRYTGNPGPNIDTDKGVIMPLDFRAIHDNTEATDLKITLINTEATI